MSRINKIICLEGSGNYPISLATLVPSYETNASVTLEVAMECLLAIASTPPMRVKGWKFVELSLLT